MKLFGLKCILVILFLGSCIGIAQTADDYYQIALKALISARESQHQGIANEKLWRTVISTAEMTLSKKDSNPAATLIIAEAYEALGLRTQAWKSWQYAWLETNDPYALESAIRLGFELAEASYFANLLEASEKYYLVLSELDAKDIRIYEGLAKIAGKQSQWDKAENYWHIVLKLEPSNQEALSALAILQTSQASSQTNPTPVIEETQPLQTAPNSPPPSLESLYDSNAVAFYREGMALYEAGQAYDARLKFIRAVELEPEFKEAWVWVGRTRFEQNSIPLAVQAFRRALALDPTNPNIKEQLAKAQARQ
jgi:tetratricopeptide (TPR) repeat protein